MQIETTIRRGRTARRQPRAAARYTIRKKDRNWAVIDPQGQLVCLYKRGVVEVVRRLAA